MLLGHTTRHPLAATRPFIAQRVYRKGSIRSPTPPKPAASPRELRTRATVADAVGTVENCLTAFSNKQFDVLLELVPDEVVDYLVQQRRPPGTEDSPQKALCIKDNPIEFDDILEPDTLQAVRNHFVLDSFALRNFIYGTPSSYKVLSSILVSPGKFLQRCAVNSKYGEESIVTFALDLEEALQPQYRGVKLASRWVLRGITGEAACDELPESPTPAAPPEVIVRAQLAALSDENLPVVYSLSSPESQAAMGPYEAYVQKLRGSPFRPLLGHQKAVSLNRVQQSDAVYMEVVDVTAKPMSGALVPERAIYIWTLSRQGEQSAKRGCWMTDIINVFQVQSQ